MFAHNQVNSAGRGRIFRNLRYFNWKLISLEFVAKFTLDFLAKILSDIQSEILSQEFSLTEILSEVMGENLASFPGLQSPEGLGKRL